MSLIKKQIALIGAALFTLLCTASGQPSIEMNYQGLLTDGGGNPITQESFDFTVKLMTAEPGRTELWNQVSTIRTDDEGWFSFSIPEISQFLMKNGKIQEPLVIQLEFLPNNSTTWIQEGFPVSYTLTPTMRDNSIYLKMARMEGSELSVHQEDNLYAFKDEYPFGYLTGGFLLTDAPPVNETSKDDLRHWIVPDPTESGASTRGVKGGFPQGGYRKR